MASGGPQWDYTVLAHGSVDEVTQAIERKTAEVGFKVLHVHDVQATLASKGFQREPLKIVEICNARAAHQVLEEDVKVSLMLPCPISVYQQGDRVYVSALRPSIMANWYESPKIGQVAEEVEEAIIQIVNSVRA